MTGNADRRWAILAQLFLTLVGLGFQFQTMASVGAPVAQELRVGFGLARVACVGFRLAERPPATAP